MRLIFFKTKFTVAFSGLLCFLVANDVSANSPAAASVIMGKQLFEQTWSQRSPRLGSDGLGPLFNAKSCVACHNQGGTGGGGAAEFNAKTIGISKLKVAGGAVSDDQLASILNDFYPGFQLPDGTLVNCASMAHHGGTPIYESARKRLLETLPAEFSDSGGPVNASEVRRANAHQIQYAGKQGRLSYVINARLFQRNTTALFGAGLIDQVPDKLIVQQAKLQERHPEISGRPSTSRSGRIGKFGWRANLPSLLHFTDQACANEVGLETKRRQQPADPTSPRYRNPSTDVSDHQVRAIRDFTAALPAPMRRYPTDRQALASVRRGEKLFESVGCAVCHVPNLGPAKGAYTDLLLHEMGYELMDLNHAEPYIRKSLVETRYVPETIEVVTGTTTGTQMMGAYYGQATVISSSATGPTETAFVQRNAWTDRDVSRGPDWTSAMPGRRDRFGYNFLAPAMPNGQDVVLAQDSDPFLDIDRRTTRESSVNVGQAGRNTGTMLRITGDFEVDRTTRINRVTRLRLVYEPTRFNEEWRTPPLWGVADSAPYMHDGRAETLLEAISMHGGESAGTRDRFLRLSKPDRDSIIDFLNTMVAPYKQDIAAVSE
ncbi:MAG: di-heme oxidoredictase family protein [Planctomycetota bacterium]